jgi:hypothetical protein
VIRLKFKMLLGTEKSGQWTKKTISFMHSFYEYYMRNEIEGSKSGNYIDPINPKQ